MLLILAVQSQGANPNWRAISSKGERINTSLAAFGSGQTLKGKPRTCARFDGTTAGLQDGASLGKHHDTSRHDSPAADDSCSKHQLGPSVSGTGRQERRWRRQAGGEGRCPPVQCELHAPDDRARGRGCHVLGAKEQQASPLKSGFAVGLYDRCRTLVKGLGAIK